MWRRCTTRKVTKALGQVAPRDAGAITMEHGIDKQAVILGWSAHVSGPTGQKVLNALPLSIGQNIAVCHALNNGALARLDDRL
jgi:hypothetical protein